MNTTERDLVLAVLIYIGALCVFAQDTPPTPTARPVQVAPAVVPPAPDTRQERSVIVTPIQNAEADEPEEVVTSSEPTKVYEVGRGAIEWRTLRQAKAEQFRTGKPILLLSSSPTCGPCRALKAGALKDPAVIALLNLEAIPVRNERARGTVPRMQVKVVTSLGFGKATIPSQNADRLYRQIQELLGLVGPKR